MALALPVLVYGNAVDGRGHVWPESLKTGLKDQAADVSVLSTTRRRSGPDDREAAGVTFRARRKKFRAGPGREKLIGLSAHELLKGPLAAGALKSRSLFWKDEPATCGSGGEGLVPGESNEGREGRGRSTTGGQRKAG